MGLRNGLTARFTCRHDWEEVGERRLISGKTKRDGSYACVEKTYKTETVCKKCGKIRYVKSIALVDFDL